MSIFRKGMSTIKAWAATAFVKPPKPTPPPVRFELPDPILPNSRVPAVREEWPFTNRYRALRKRRNKAARIARRVMRENAK